MTLSTNSGYFPETVRLPAGGPPMPPGIGGAVGGARRFNTLDPLRVFRQNLRLLLFSGVVGVVLGVGIWFLLKQTYSLYRSEAMLTVNARITNPLLLPGAGSGQQRMEYVEAQMMSVAERIKWQDVADQTLRRPAVRDTAWFRKFDDNLYKAREALYNNLTARPIRGSTQVYLAMTGLEEKDMPVILDAVLGVYENMIKSEANTEGVSFRTMISQELTEADRELRRLTEQIEAFLSEHNLTDLEGKNTQAAIEFQQLVQQSSQLLMAFEATRASYEGMLQTMQTYAGGAGSPEELWQIESMPQIAQRNEQIRAMRERREVMLERFGERHRQVQQLDAYMAAIEQERDIEIDRLLREQQEVKLQQARKAMMQYQAQFEAMQPKLEEVTAQLQDMSSKLQRYALMEKELDRATTRRDSADDRLRYQRMLEQRPDAVEVRVVSRATNPELYFPKPLIVIPAVTFLTLLGVAGVVMLRELIDQRVRTPMDVSMLPDCELLGVLPDAGEDPSGNGDGKLEGVVQAYPTGLMAESFRQVRGALLTRIDRRGYKTLMLVGAQAEAGVSSVLSNLAVSMATSGRRVLVMDLNFRRPAQHRMFGVPSQPGLIEVLSGAAELEEAIIRLEDPVLDVLPVGDTKHATSELFDSASFRAVLSRVEGQYDIVLLDAPPALVTSDSAHLAREVDAIALVVRAMREKRGMISRMFSQFEGLRAEVLGVIVNGVRSSAGGYFRKSYEQFYRYRQAEARPNNRRRVASKETAPTTKN